MHLEQNRILKACTFTISELMINGEHICDILEDKVRPLPPVCPNTPKGFACKCDGKIAGETAIPVGTYEIVLSYSNRFKKVLPELLNVPHFLGIRIHTGNSSKDTDGCLIPGTWDGRTVDWVSSSKVAYDKLLKYIQSAVDRKEKVTITIKDIA